MLTIYKASAGSGKTFTLAYEYLKKLLGVKQQGADTYRLNADKYSPSGKRRADRHRGILAITFTNAATEEMKTRIVKELARLAHDEDAADSIYAQWMMRDFGCTADELRDAARHALAEVLYDYGNFNVSTIDSFFQGVLRTFSREVDHQGDYELSLDTEATVRQSISLMLDDLNYSRPKNATRLYNWIQQYTMGQLARGNGYNFFLRNGAILKNLAKNMSDAMDETYAANSKALRQYLSDPSRVQTFSNLLRIKAEAAMQPPKQTASAFFSALASAGLSSVLFNSTIVSRMKELHEGSPLGDIKGKTVTDAASGALPPEKLAVKTRCKDAKVDVAGLTPYLQLMADFCAQIHTAVPERDFYNTLDSQLGVLDFYGMALQKLEEYLRENNTVLISDTGELLSRIISDAEMPFIYERLGMKLTNLLIDEFQDTSRLQWKNLKPLVANSLAEGNDNLIIGDEKQAIYRFRNSDSELLGHIVQTVDFPDKHTLRGFEAADNTNHRSAGDIVRFNNTVFSRMAAILGVGSYGNVVQTPCERFAAQSAFIDLRFYDEGQEPEPEAILEETAQAMLAQHSRGYRWRDILILTRGRKEASATVEYLTKNHPEIAVLSSEALLLSSSGAVRTIMSMLKLVEGSYAGKSAAGSEKKEYGSRSDIVMMITRFNYYLSEGYDNPEALRLALDDSGSAAGSLDAEIMAIRAENPANLVALIEAIVALKVTGRQRKAEYAYIAALQDLAIKHSDGPDPSLAAFINAYDSNIDSWAIKAPADIDAVQVMTIHKSKGLERACVHIPFGDWEMVHPSQSLWLPMELLKGFPAETVPPVLRVTATSTSPLRNRAVSPFAELIEQNDKAELTDSFNLCYVAFTRAARELTVHSTTEKIGRYVLDAITRPADSAELADDARTDLAANFCDGRLTIGSPTYNDRAGDDSRVTSEAGEYPVVFRSDARELTSIDDALATHLDIGGEDDKYIVDKEPFDPRLMEAARRGNDLHSILAATRTIDDLRNSVARQAARTGLSEAEQAECYRKLSDAIADGGETVAAWFDPVNRVYAERSIYVSARGLSFRPDRVVISPDGSTSVVDYKFTTEPRPEHFSQVENYLRLLRELGRGNARGYLWYPLLGQIREVRI